MESAVFPIYLFAAFATLVAVAMLIPSRLLAPRRSSAVKQMPYESGMDPIHDARRRFDVRFHLVAVAFMLFDVELLFLYPWAVASKPAAAGEAPRGIDAAISAGLISSRGLVFAEAMVFIGLLALGFVYAWRKGIFQWR